MSPDNKKRIAADCWKKGNEAMQKQNFDYAVDMHGKAVLLAPENIAFRQTLRGCERKLYNENKTGAKMAGIRLTGIRNRIKKARSKQDWTAMDQAAEEGLKLNPWDTQLNADLGEACFNLGYTQIAEYAYKTAVDNDGDNAELLRKLANIYELRGGYSEAIECWRRISKLEPNNGEVRAKITGLEAMAVMDRGGYEGAKTTQEVRRSAYDDYRPTGQSAPEAVAGPGVSLEADLQRAIRKTPADKTNYVKLSDFYRRQKEFAKAAEILQQALEVTGGDFNIRELMDDTELERLRHEIELAKVMAAKDESGRKQVDALKRELHLREIEVLSSRVSRYPMDAALKYQLATRFMKSREFGKAIPLLQQAVGDIRREAEVRVALGRCFIADKKDKMAQVQFEKAVERVNPHDNPDLYCEAHYILARLCERAADRERAEAEYQEVLGVNYSYEDARQRLERLQSGGEASKS
jgi:tetratricopeptide (TPR) repeat protein